MKNFKHQKDLLAYWLRRLLFKQRGEHAKRLELKKSMSDPYLRMYGKKKTVEEKFLTAVENMLAGKKVV